MYVCVAHCGTVSQCSSLGESTIVQVDDGELACCEENKHLLILNRRLKFDIQGSLLCRQTKFWPQIVYIRFHSQFNTHFNSNSESESDLELELDLNPNLNLNLDLDLNPNWNLDSNYNFAISRPKATRLRYNSLFLSIWRLGFI